jgi:hypothetical protein
MEGITIFEMMKSATACVFVPEDWNQSRTGWWFGTCEKCSIIYGMSAYPLTNSIIFQMAQPPTSHPVIDGYELLLYNLLIPIDDCECWFNLGCHSYN